MASKYRTDEGIQQVRQKTSESGAGHLFTMFWIINFSSSHCYVQEKQIKGCKLSENKKSFVLHQRSIEK